jgi:hypothetical protein
MKMGLLPEGVLDITIGEPDICSRNHRLSYCSRRHDLGRGLRSRGGQTDAELESRFSAVVASENTRDDAMRAILATNPDWQDYCS